MKKTTLLLGLMFPICLWASIVPDRVVTPALDIYHSSNEILPNGEVNVKVSEYNEKGEFKKASGNILLSIEDYNNFKKLANAVLRMNPNRRFKNITEFNRGGTAFNIGNNLILTNLHVLDPTFKNKTSCGDFQLYDYKKEMYGCKKVHFCDEIEDICLIEMKPKKKCNFKCKESDPDISLAVGPTLKLNPNYSPIYQNLNEEIMTAIGNTQLYGIHLSQGRGISYSKKNEIYFWAPITFGNSGGPLIDHGGNVIGIVKAQSKLLYGQDPKLTCNIAADISRVIPLIKNALKDDQETLEKFNQSVIE